MAYVHAHACTQHVYAYMQLGRDAWQVGQPCEARYAAKNGAKAGWFRGSIISAHLPSACHVRYTDGDVERNVPMQYIRSDQFAVLEPCAAPGRGLDDILMIS